MTHVGGAERTRLEREYVPLAEKATSLAVTFILVIVVAKHFGKDVTSLVAALGVGSLAIGLAAQQTLGNMIAGFVLLVDRPFRPGDRVRLATGEIGEVQLIGVRSTRIRLVDGNQLTVPNAELANSRVVTYHVLTTHSDVKLTVALGSDVDRVSALLAAVAAEDSRVRGADGARVERDAARDRAHGRLRHRERAPRRSPPSTSCAAARSCGCRRSGSGCPISTSRRRACRAARPYKRRGRCRS